MKINYLKHNAIDFNAWDECISSSVNPRIYATSSYLNIVSPGWDALITDDYRCVMPLTHKKKFGVSYIFHPPLTQQLGIFSIEFTNTETTKKCIEAIPRKFRLVDMPMNTAMPMDQSLYSEQGITHHLSLQPGYTELHSGYSENTCRNIARAVKNQLHVTQSSDFGVISYMINAGCQPWVGGLGKETIKDVEKKLLQLLINGIGSLFTVLDSNNEVFAAAVFSQYRGYITYLFGISSDTGKDKRAMFLAFDTIIHTNSGSNIILDFEGSSIEGIARFFRGFGATPVYFPKLKINNLPAAMRYFKK
ncbi:MAG: hypothetical protein KBB11_09350 [Bacteroidales bacterium]|nr:hypothetical protein [Bacteroidales bacterium]HOY38354.1 hypothetical protein [Bacteroidales bacterium]HQP03449.1 hypothetical protein [Bacteroidales bacterium]